MTALISSRILEAALFAAATVFTVVSLEIYRVWLERGADIAQARAAGALLAFVFFAMVAVGIAEFTMVGKLSLLNLGFFLNGAAGLSILPSLLFRQNKEQELRRIDALDL